LGRSAYIVAFASEKVRRKSIASLFFVVHTLSKTLVFSRCWNIFRLPPAMSIFKSRSRLLVISLSISVAFVALAAEEADAYLPLVDLGYEVHQASHNVSLDSYL
jgi:cholinesterase